MKGDKKLTQSDVVALASGPEPFDEPWPRSNSTFDQNYSAAFVLRVRAAFLSCEAEP